jgi:uncharacterized membrane protein YeaQ/YmgE (transglycosylase-associated protein family)
MPKESKPGLTRAIVLLVLACLIGLVAPHFVPETPGSPGTIVAILLLWIVGASLAFVGVAMAAKAFFTRR